MFFSQQQGTTTNSITDSSSSIVPSLDWNYVREAISSISDMGDSEFSSLFDRVETHLIKIGNINDKSENFLTEKIRIYNLFGYLNYLNCDIDKAEEYFMKAQSTIQLLINFKTEKIKNLMQIHVTNNLGVIQLQNGKIKEAIDTFTNALRICLENEKKYHEFRHISTTPFLNLGLIYLKIQNDLDKSEECFLKVIERDSFSFEAWINLSDIYTIYEDYEEALKCCYKAKKINPQNSRVLTTCALIKHRMGWDSEAIHILDEAKQRDPNNPSIYTLFGVIYRERQMHEIAIECFLKAMDLSPYQIFSLENIIDIYLENGQYDLAHKLLEQSMMKIPLFIPTLQLKRSVFHMIGFETNTINTSTDSELPMENLLKCSQLELLHGHLPFGIRSKLVEKSSLHNISLTKFHNGDVEGALYTLLNGYQIDSSIFTQDIYNNSTIQNMCSLYPHAIKLLWMYFIKLGSPVTALVLMKILYDKHIMLGKKPGSRDCSVMFWYYAALAYAGIPWRLVDYSKFIFEDVNKRDDFPYYLQVLAYNRMEVSESGEQLDELTRQHVEKCFEEMKSIQDYVAITYEKVMFSLRNGDYNSASSMLPKQPISEMIPDFQFLMAKILYKKKSSIAARQALQIITLLLRRCPKHFEYLYLRLKLFLLLDENNFRNHYKDFSPITLEFSIKKLKLGVKYYINHFDPEKAQEELEKLEKLVENVANWRDKNQLSEFERAIHDRKYKTSIRFLKANIKYISTESYYSILNLMSDITPIYLKKPKTLIFELKYTQLAPTNQYYLTQFFEKADNTLKLLDIKSQTLCWQFIILYCLRNGMKRQALSVLNNMGSTRFARVDTLYALCAIAFMLDMSDNLESYLSKVDLSMIRYHSKSNVTKKILSEFDMFKLRVIISKMQRATKFPSEFQTHIEEFRITFNSCFPFLDYLKTLYKEQIVDHIITNYLLLTSHLTSQDTIIQRLLNESPDLLPLSYIQSLIESTTNYPEKKKLFDAHRKSFSETVSLEDRTNFQVLECLKNNDKTLLTTSTLATTDTFLFCKKCFSATLETITEQLSNIIFEKKKLSLDMMKALNIMLKGQVDSVTYQWLSYEIFKREETIPFFEKIQQTKSSYSMTERNIFISIEGLPFNQNYVKTVQSIYDRYEQPIIRNGHLLLAHILRISHTKETPLYIDESQKASLPWFLTHTSMDSLIQELFSKFTECIQSKEIEIIKTRPTPENPESMVSQQFQQLFLDGDKNKLFWKCISYIFSSEKDGQNTLRERLQLLSNIASNVNVTTEEIIRINFEFILHEWRIRDSTFNYRFSKIQEKTNGEFLLKFCSLFFTLKEHFTRMSTQAGNSMALTISESIFNTVFKESQLSIRKSSHTEWKEFVQYISSKRESPMDKTWNFTLYRLKTFECDWRVWFSILCLQCNTNQNLDDTIKGSLLTLFFEAVLRTCYCASSYGNSTVSLSSEKSVAHFLFTQQKERLKIDELLYHLSSYHTPCSMDLFAYQHDDDPAHEEMSSIFKCVRSLIPNFFNFISKLTTEKDKYFTEIQYLIRIMANLLEFGFLEPIMILENVNLVTVWAQMLNFILEFRAMFQEQEFSILLSNFLCEDKKIRTSRKIYYSLRSVNFLLEFLNSTSEDILLDFLELEIISKTDLPPLKNELMTIHRVLNKGLDCNIEQLQFTTSLISLFKSIGKLLPPDHSHKWLTFVKFIEFSKLSNNNDTTTWEIRIYYEGLEQNDSLLLLVPVGNIYSNEYMLETQTSCLVQSLTEKNREIGILSHLKIGTTLFKMISSGESLDLRSVKSLYFATSSYEKKQESNVSYFLSNYAARKHSLLSLDVETKKKQVSTTSTSVQQLASNVIITRYSMYNNSWYEKLDKLIKELARWSAVCWFIGLSMRSRDSSIRINIEKAQLIHDELCYTLLYGISKEHVQPFRYDADIEAIIQSYGTSGIQIFEKELYTMVNMLLSPLQIQKTLFYISLLTENDCKLVSDHGDDSSQSNYLSMLHVDRYNLDTNEKIPRGDKYLYKLLKRNFKLEKMLEPELRRELQSTAAGRGTQQLALKEHDVALKSVTHHRSPYLELNDRIVDLFLSRVHGWLLIFNAVSTSKDEEITFENCGIRCTNIQQLCSELIAQSKLFSRSSK
ncbi:hypothetical protein C9374_006677 [Naegleria lovaniensis]|uniref:Uncharacterized protein n=1 Tax=Naegleria lovaniensis TaxID=51637 RepID=A0AA88GMN2_NAELO|nr:uncharacterized protein C9374_006677 [Naegleria lovaniensis]KAG2379560.1 hypothetical protein C9374_006677 [Naegleria lovaniensis]